MMRYEYTIKWRKCNMSQITGEVKPTISELENKRGTVLCIKNGFG